MIVGLGILSAISAAVVVGRFRRTQNALWPMRRLPKSALSWLKSVWGLRYLALIHLIGHACMRSLQLLRAPSLMRDYKTLENAIGKSLDHGERQSFAWLGNAFQRRLFRFALQRGHFDSMLDECVVKPFFRLFSLFDRWEHAWTHWISGAHAIPDHRQEAIADE